MRSAGAVCWSCADDDEQQHTYREGGYSMRWVRSKRMVVLAILLAVLLVLSGVGFSSVAAAFSYGDFVTQLRAAGATVTTASGSPGTFFTGTGHDLAVNGERVEVYEYPLSLAADLDASRVSSDCSTFRSVGGAVMVEWIAPPHCYKRGRVIALYVGSTAAMTHLLTAVLGTQFAGRS